jgi:hypothetical protein
MLKKEQINTKKAEGDSISSETPEKCFFLNPDFSSM